MGGAEMTGQARAYKSSGALRLLFSILGLAFSGTGIELSSETRMVDAFQKICF
jgi:hypothetical protein